MLTKRLVRRVAMAVLLASAAVSLAAGAPTPYPDVKDDTAWPGKGPIRTGAWMADNRKAFWAWRGRDEGAVVFAGDSLTGGWKADAMAKAFPGLKVANRGIGGDVSRGLLFRFKEDVLDLKPAAIVLCIGTNDLSAHGSPADVERNVAALIDQARAADPKVPIVLCQIPPRDRDKAPTQPGALADLNARLAKLGEGKERLVVVDLFTTLAKPDGKPAEACFAADKLHLAPPGYEKWGELVRAAFEKLGVKQVERASPATTYRWVATGALTPVSERYSAKTRILIDELRATSLRAPTSHQNPGLREYAQTRRRGSFPLTQPSPHRVCPRRSAHPRVSANLSATLSREGPSPMFNAYAALAKGAPLEPYQYDPGELKPKQVEIAVKYCGVCHSDLSMLDNEWGMSNYPVVGGHEVVGTVAAIGSQVTRVKVGQTVGLGWFSGSCLTCDQCTSGNQNLCATAESTIVGRFGGFADRVRGDEIWATPLPDNLDPSKAGPLFCGGITVFNPIVQFGVKPTDRVAVSGIGGLGHMALQFLKAWGCEVTAFTTSDSKRDEAMKLGAHKVVNTKRPDELAKIAGKLDFILNTANADLDWAAFITALAPKGKLHTVGVTPQPIPAAAFALIMGQKSISGSPLGSPSTVSQMLEFCGRHGIAPVTQEYAMKDVNAALDHLRAGKARYRVVLKA